jgi:hypothetical protein
MFSRALMNLSFNDRSTIEEEIHGVTCMAPDETPLFITDYLSQLVVEIDCIPNENKVAYNQASSSSNNIETAYIHSNEFRLRFLRSELFDPKKAAFRLVKYLDLILEIYGKDTLMRGGYPLLDDFNKEEMAFLRGGDYQLLPYRVSSSTVNCIIIEIRFPFHVSSSPEEFSISHKYTGLVLSLSLSLCNHHRTPFPLRRIEVVEELLLL